MDSKIFIDVKIAASKQLAILNHCSASLKEMASAPTFARFTVAKSMMCRELSMSDKGESGLGDPWKFSGGVINATVRRNRRRRKPIPLSPRWRQDSFYGGQNLQSCGRGRAEVFCLLRGDCWHW